MQAMAILWIVYSLWVLLHWAIAVGVLTGIFAHWGHERTGFDGMDSISFFHATWLVPLITAVLVGRAILCLAAGISLLRRASWARILAIVTAFLALIHPITGTILGIYTLWVLLPAASGQEYDQMAAA
jgi:Na+/H+-dicarboxylate symporter